VRIIKEKTIRTKIIKTQQVNLVNAENPMCFSSGIAANNADKRAGGIADPAL